ncbi:MAG: hypothetical protein AAGI66_04085 [Cyanobacteria bacterium P01_H01_bin.74]
MKTSSNLLLLLLQSNQSHCKNSRKNDIRNLSRELLETPNANQGATETVFAEKITHSILTPDGIERLLKAFTRFFSVFGFIILVFSAIVYGIRVNYQDKVNRLIQDGRALNAKNQMLTIDLTEIKSYKTIEANADKLGNLQAATDVIQITVPKKSGLLPKTQPKSTDKSKAEEFPRFYGY